MAILDRYGKPVSSSGKKPGGNVVEVEKRHVVPGSGARVTRVYRIIGNKAYPAYRSKQPPIKFGKAMMDAPDVLPSAYVESDYVPSKNAYKVSDVLKRMNESFPKEAYDNDEWDEVNDWYDRLSDATDVDDFRTLLVLNGGADSIDDLLTVNDNAPHKGLSANAFGSAPWAIGSEFDTWIPEPSLQMWRNIGVDNDALEALWNTYYDNERGIQMNLGKHPFSGAMADNYRNSKVYKDKFSDWDRQFYEDPERFFDARDLPTLKKALAYHLVNVYLDNPAIPDGMKASLADELAKKPMNYLADISLEGGGHGLYDRVDEMWPDIIYDRMVMALSDTLSGAVNRFHGTTDPRKGIVLVGGSVPLGRINEWESVAEGEFTAQRDSSSEIVIPGFVPEEIYADLGTLSERINKYWNMRFKDGKSGEESWNECFGKIYHSKDDDMSDERIKDVFRKQIKKDCDDCLSYQNICNSLTRGPGNG